MIRSSVEEPPMLRISKLTDYGIVLLARFAELDGAATQSAREMAEASALPFPVVGKVLKILSQEGILESHRGAKGGYALARPAREISVAEIVAALEGPIALTECSAGPGHCEQESFCQVRAPWQRINRAILDTLRTVTLDQLAHAESTLLVPLSSGLPAPRGNHV
jgi:FeS assembly SUF system regulator